MPSPKDERSPWDAIARCYAHAVLSPLEEEVDNPLWGWLPELAARHKGHVIDLGCGAGTLLGRLREHWPMVFGLDFSGEMLLEAKTRPPPGGRAGSVHLIRGDMRLLPLREECVELVFSVNSIFFADPKTVLGVLGALARSTKPGGRLIAVLPSLEAILHLRELRRRTYRGAGLGKDRTEGFLREEFEVRHKLDEGKGIFALDGRHPQRHFREEEIRSHLEKSGYHIEEIAEVLFPWALLRQRGWGNFPGEKPIWNWLIRARKA